MVYTPPQPSDWPDTVRISFDYIDPEVADDYWYNHGEHYEHYCCVAKPENCTGPQERAPYTHWMPLPAAPGTDTPEDPITVALDPDPRGVSVGVWQGSHCIYNGAHAVPVAPGDAQDGNDVLSWLEVEIGALSCRYYGDPSYDHDAYWMRDRVLKLIEDARRAFCAPAAGDALELTLAQKYEGACILANANAQDAARYRSHRAALTSVNTAWLDNVTAALEAMGLDPDDADALPTAAQVDAAFDAAIAAQAPYKGDAA